MNIDLLSTHEPWKLSWRKRLRYAWFTLRYGTAVAPYIEIVRPDEADHLVDAIQHARIAAFGPQNPSSAPRLGRSPDESVSEGGEGDVNGAR